MAAMTPVRSTSDPGIGIGALPADILNAVPGRLATVYTPELPAGAAEGFWHCFGAPQELLEEYAEYYKDHDVWAMAARRPTPPPTGAVLDTDRLVEPGILARSTFYNDYLCRYGISRSLVAIVDDGRTGLLPRIRLTVARGPGEPGFSAAEAAHLRSLARLARSFAMLIRARDGLARTASLQQSALDLLRIPIFLVDHDRGVLVMNAAAEEVLRSGSPTELRGGRLRARNPAIDRDLGAALRNAAQHPEKIHFVRLGPGRPLVKAPALMITALADRGDLVGPPVLAFRLLRQDQLAGNAETVLRDLLGLTPGESEVALGLAEGLSHEMIAERRGVSVHTVRSLQRRLQEKLGISRSGPLSRFVLDTIAIGGFRY